MATKLDDMESQVEDNNNKVNRYFKFWFLVIGILFFFGLHNYMQELIMNLPGFKVLCKKAIKCFVGFILFL